MEYTHDMVPFQKRTGKSLFSEFASGNVCTLVRRQADEHDAHTHTACPAPHGPAWCPRASRARSMDAHCGHDSGIR